MVHFVEIIIFGSLLLLSFLLLTNPFKVNAKANRWLGVFTFLWSSYWLEEVVQLATGKSIEVSSFIGISFIQFLAPICFYFGVRYFTNPNYKFTVRSGLYLVVPAVYLVILILQQISSFNYHPILITVVMLHASYYIFISYISIFRHQRQIKRFASNMQGIDLYWLEYIIIVIVALLILFNILYYKTPLNIIMNLITLVTVFFVSYNALKQKEIYPLDKKDREDAISAGQEETTELPKRKIISDERLVELKDQLNELMLKDEPYLDTELDLMNLSKQLQVSSNHLSYVINNGFNENFYSYINKFRIEKAKKLLDNKKTNHLSIIGVAYESGFSSKTSFNTTFKKMTGSTPSEFKKRCSNL